MRIILAFILSLLSSGAWAQCNGVFPANTLCGNLSGSPAPPAAFSAGGTVIGPASTTSGHIVTFGSTVGTSLFDQATITTSQALFITGITGFQSNATFSRPTSFNGLTNFTSTFQVNTQTMTFPAAADTLGGLATSQSWTATNNFSGALRGIGDTTLSHVISEFFNPAIPVGSGGTAASTLSAHAVLLGNGTGPVSGTTLGSTGQCLGSGGASLDPAYSSGCWVLLNTLLPVNTASIQDTTSLTNTYSKYKVELSNVTAVTAGAQLGMQFQTFGSFANSNYAAIWNGESSTGGGTARVSVPTSFFALSSGTGIPIGSPGVVGQVVIYSPSVSSPVLIDGRTSAPEGSGAAQVATGNATGFISQFAAATGVKFLFTTGNISTGTIRIYGGL